MTSPRLLDVYAAAAYLSVSVPSVRGYVTNGDLIPLRVPSTRRIGELSRRLLFAREDLDALIDRWKAASTAEPNRQLSRAALKGWNQSPLRIRKGKGYAA